MDFEVITLDDSDDDNAVMDNIKQNEAGFSAKDNESTSSEVELDEEETEEASFSGFLQGDLSFFDFKPFIINADANDENAEDDDYDPSEEIDIDDIETWADRPVKFDFAKLHDRKVEYSYPNDEFIDELVKSKNFKMESLKSKLPESFVKRFGSRHAAFVAVSFYLNDCKQKQSHDNFIDFIMDLARKTGATEEQLQKIEEDVLKNLAEDQIVPVTREVKQEIWVTCVAEISKNPDLPDIDEEVETCSARSSPIEVIEKESEIECIVIDED